MNQLMITADGGGSNGSRVRLFKVELQNLACQSASKKDPLSACKRDPFRCDLCEAMDVSLFG